MQSSEPIDEYELMALSKRLGISVQEMREMSFTSLLNILLANIESNTSTGGVRNATQEDIDRLAL